MLNLERPLVSIDLETTGEHPEKDRIVQLGLVKLYPGGRETEYMTLVNPGMSIAPEISEIHGITDEDVKDAPFFDSTYVAGYLQVGLVGCDVLGYNLKRFDLRIIKEEFRRCRKICPEWMEVIDAGRIFHIKDPRTLIAAAKKYLNRDVEEEAHDALFDARLTKDVLLGQLEFYPELPRSVPELARFCDEGRPGGNSLDPEGKFAWRHNRCIVNFGNKHLLVPLEEVAQRDPGYLKWMLNGDFSDQVKAICTLALKGEFPTRG